MTNDTLYRAEEAVLSTPVLVCLGTCILTVCGFILAFLMNTLLTSHLQQAGYVPYNNASTARVIFDFLDLDDTPSEAIWYHYVPGQSLAYAFAYMPLAQAIISGLGFLLAGSSMLVFCIPTSRTRLHPKHGAVIFLLIGLATGFVPIFHTAPSVTITADLQSHTISSNQQSIAIIAPLQMSIIYHYSHSRHSSDSYYTLDVQNPNGNRMSLITARPALLNQIEIDMNNFLNSQGGQP